MAAVPVTVLLVDPSGLSPFGPVKWALLPTAVLLLASLQLRGRVSVLRKAALLWLGFLIVVFATAAFGVDPLYAWIGTPERHFGAITWLLCAVAFMAGSNLGDRSERLLVTTCAVVAVLVSVWSVAELLGWEPVALAGTAGRPVGPLGSSAFLGATAVLLAPIAAQRSPWLGAVAVAALPASGARAAWVGAAVAAAVFAVARRPPRRVAIGGALLLAVLVALMGGRATDVASDERGGARGRLDEWRVAARTVAANPFGVGPEGYRIVFEDHVDERYDRIHGRDPLPDRAHSALLDVAITTGIPGLLLYVALLAVVARAVVRALHTHPGIAAGLLAYMTQSLFLFPLGELDPLAWLLAGVVVRPDVEVEIPAPVPVLAGALAAVSLTAGVLDVAADRESKRVLDALVDGRLPRGTGPANLRPDQLRYHLLAARAAEARGTPTGYRDARRHLDDALGVSPRDPVVRAEIRRLADGT